VAAEGAGGGGGGEEARTADAPGGGVGGAAARGARRLAELRRRLEEARRAADAAREAELSLPALDARAPVAVKREEIYQHLRALGEPPTKMYPGQLPLFPLIYRLEVRFDLPAEEPAPEAGPPPDQ